MALNKELKLQIINEIDSLPESEQETVLGIVENYIHSREDETQWDQLPDAWKKRIQESLKLGDEGKHILNEDAEAYIRKKHGLDG